MRTKSVIVSAFICIALMIIGPVLEPVVTGWVHGIDEDEPSTRADIVPGPYRDLKGLVEDLLSVTTDLTDSDEDGLPDTVERIIGTDVLDSDSDHDTLNDSFEVSIDLDPQKVDSNGDGFVDPKEVKDVPLDADKDGVMNGWDRDNDNDGFEDMVDRSPFSRTGQISSIHLDVTRSGRPLYITMQLRPRNPDQLRMMIGTMDWPYDEKGTMRDLDNSKDDLMAAPVLRSRGSNLPDQGEVLEYGMVVGQEDVITPLSAEWSDGRMIGLSGRMFFPATEGGTSLALDIGMDWIVKGMTDSEVRTIKAKNGNYLSSEDKGPVRANSSEISEPQRFVWERLDDNNVSIRSFQGYYLGIDEEGDLTSGFGSREDNCIFRVQTNDGSQVMIDTEGRYLSLRENGTIGMVKDRSDLTKFEIKEDGVRKNSITLMNYPEEFIVASLSVTECYGSELGLFYSDDTEQMLAANMFLSSAYLRNSSLELGDLPAFMVERDINVSSSIESFSHSDLATKAAVSGILNDIIEGLPEGGAHCITTVVQDSYSLLDITNTTYGVDGKFSADMTEELPITTRMMKTTWYESPLKEPLAPVSFLPVVLPYLEGLEDEDQQAMVATVLYWCTGEVRVVKIGDNVTEENGTGFERDPAYWVGLGLGITMLLLNFVKDYVLPFLEFITTVIQVIKEFQLLSYLGLVEGTWETVSTVLRLFKDASGWGQTASIICYGIGMVLSIIGLAIDVTFLIINLIAMVNAAHGDPLAVGQSILFFVMALSLTITIFIFSNYLSAFLLLGTLIAALAAIPVINIIVGIIAFAAAIVGALFALEEFIVSSITGRSGTQWLIWWIILWMSGQYPLTEVDLDFVRSQIVTHDWTNNGLDAKDRIEIEYYWNSTVKRTTDASEAQFYESYAKPIYRVNAPNVSYEQGASTGNSSSVLSYDNGTAQRTELYRSAAWIEPGFAMPDYPIVVDMMIDYSRYVQQYLFWGALKLTPVKEAGVQSSDHQTFYFDVMPATFDDLIDWDYLTRSDTDGDMINDTDEVGTDPLNWDTDGDQLGDRFEIDSGYLPNDADSDRDGLWDIGELRSNLDPSDKDTDDDGLTDLQELEGWIVNFTYNGHPFEWHIVSDPSFPDTDGDGLNDTIEYLCLLNPMSYDTNGDGTEDEVLDYTTTEIEYVNTIGDGDDLDLNHCDSLSVDGEGNVLLIGNANQSVIKIGPDGGMIWEYVDPNMTTAVDRFYELRAGPNGLIFALAESSYEPCVIVLNSNGTYRSTIFFGKDTYVMEAFAIDEEGCVYNVGTYDLYGVHILKFYPNGTLARSYEFPSGSGQPFPGGVQSFPKTDWDGSLAIDSKGRLFITDPTTGRILIFDRDFEFLDAWYVGQFGLIRDVRIDDHDSIYVCGWDSGHDLIQKFDRYRRVIVEWTTTLIETTICPGPDEHVYVGGVTATGTFRGRIMRFWENITLHQVASNWTFIDTDDEGLTDVLESAGWNITVRFFGGPIQVHVASNPVMPDSDMDGLDDLMELSNGSDPMSIDTDQDGLTDLTEVLQGTNITSWDTDGDGLGDGQESAVGSDPLRPDADGDGLSDLNEYEQGSDPNDPDTDRDGLSDKEERDLGWSPVSPDGDGDFMFDGDELYYGCDPKNSDYDQDGIADGYEGLYMTSPTIADSDGDDLNDGFELRMYIEPTDNDTDDDNLSDSRELEIGYNPRSSDSDGDGISDEGDMDYTIDLGGEVVIVSDGSEDGSRFVSDLSRFTDVRESSPGDFLENLTGSDFVVIIGRPNSEEGTSGKIVRDLLVETEDLLWRMITSEEERCIVRYGVWKKDQTVVLLSHPYPFDHNRVMGVLRSMRMMVEDGHVIANVLSPVDFKYFDNYEVMRETDTYLKVSLTGNRSFTADIASSDSISPIPAPVFGNGLELEEVDMGKYVSIELTDLEGTELPLSSIASVELRVYYTLEDLDLDVDGSSDGPMDLDESSLCLLVHSDGNWTKLQDLDRTTGTGIETNDVKVFGREYSGFLWFTGEHLSTFGIVGKRNERQMFDLEVGPVIGTNGAPIEGAEVTLFLDRAYFNNFTGPDGSTVFTLPTDAIGRTVRIRVEKAGYEDIDYVTNIMAGGYLQEAPPRMIKVDGEEDSGGISAVLIALVVAILMLMVLVGYLVISRRKRAEKEE